MIDPLSSKFFGLAVGPHEFGLAVQKLDWGKRTKRARVARRQELARIRRDNRQLKLKASLLLTAINIHLEQLKQRGEA